jgi:hypothetical protein
VASSFVGKVCNHFENVTDPRVNRGDNYPLIEMMFVALVTVHTLGKSWN